MVAHFRSNAMVSMLITTTAPATRRADTSLTGSGNENSPERDARCRLPLVPVMLHGHTPSRPW